MPERKPLPLPSDPITVVGAAATAEQAEQMVQMRYILTWALHMRAVARPAPPPRRGRAHPAGPRASTPPM